MNKQMCVLFLYCLFSLLLEIGRAYHSHKTHSSMRRLYFSLQSSSGVLTGEEKSKPPFMPFWMQEDRVKFSCTGCGRCCQNDGEVWFNLEEFTELAMSLNMPAETALELYVEEVKSDWVKMKNKVVATPSNSWIPNLIQDSDQCIFLGLDGKACSIYDQRPIQCRTYPYWPRLLKDVKEWKKEIVVSENKSGKHWNPKDGGCEGIDHENATSIPSKKIFINKQLFELYHQAFPILQTHHDKERLILKFDVMKV